MFKKLKLMNLKKKKNKIIHIRLKLSNLILKIL